eukprot:GHVR01113584.1.p1 GENE.GHVR01113584.1~~GHVR01113584.1.p1  ORF type:complete len:118 (+),score=8.05 GHVR01113584.1:2454-2807(+)
MKQIYKGLHFFCLGLSLGGLTAYHLSLTDNKMFTGVILMAPALKNTIGGFLVGMTKTLAKLLPQKAKLTKPIYGKAAKNPLISEDVQKDKWAFSDRISLSTVNILVSTMDKSPSTFS